MGISVTMHVREEGYDFKRPVVSWNKHCIVRRWLAHVSLICSVVILDIIGYHILYKYKPEGRYVGYFLMVIGNVISAGVLGAQARMLIDDSETVNDVPWWCYGCTSSTRPNFDNPPWWLFAPKRMTPRYLRV